MPLVVGRVQQQKKWPGWSGICVAALSGLVACQPASSVSRQQVIMVDGSSTLFPLAEAFAEDFQRSHGVAVAVGSSSSSGGISRLCHAEVDIATASRPMTLLEIQQCQQAGVRFIELPVALDAIAVVVHPANQWASCLTVAQLKQLWQPQAQGQQSRWQHLDAGFPDSAVHLYGAGVSSGTYDYFTAAIVGKRHASRGDYAASEDDNITVRGIAGDPQALGFMGLSYYQENKALLKAVAIRQPDGQCRLPDSRNAQAGQYRPLTRALFMYVSSSALRNKPDVGRFVSYMLDSRQNVQVSSELGFVPLTAPVLQRIATKLAQQQTGSDYAGDVAGDIGQKGLHDLFDHALISGQATNGTTH